MSIIGNGKRYSQLKYNVERDFEDDVVSSSKMLFGRNTIYINAKKKVDSKSLGGTVPDGFFFDFGDPSDPQFYMVEVELSGHGFYSHVFPQITKFFAFFRNTKLQKSLVDRIFSVINGDEALRSEFRKHIGQLEVYKFLSDIIESSQNILLIADGRIVELPEIMDTYTDTWGKMVRYLEVRRYQSGPDIIYTIEPDFETLQYEAGEVAEDDEVEDQLPKYPESYHLEGVSQNSLAIYNQIKEIIDRSEENLTLNPQKYYISIKAGKNIAFLKIRKKKIRFIAMLPEVEIRKCVSQHTVVALSAPVQEFYNGPCAAVEIQDLDHMDEIELLLRMTVEYNTGASDSRVR